MKNIIILGLAVMAACPLCAQGVVQSAAAQDEAAVRSAVSGMMDAVMRSAEKMDVEQIFAPLSHDQKAVFFFGFQPFTRDALIPFFRQAYGQAKSQSIRLTHTDVKVLGPDAALWLGWGTGRIDWKDGRVTEQALAETWLWQRVDGQWKVIHSHESAATLPSPQEKKQVEAALGRFAAQLKGRPLSKGQAFGKLKDFLKKNPKIAGSAFAFAPVGGVKAAPYVFRSGDDLRQKDLSSADYTAADWYAQAAAGGAWTQPYFDAEGAEIFMVTHSLLVYAADGKTLMGVATADWALPQ